LGDLYVGYVDILDTRGDPGCANPHTDAVLTSYPIYYRTHRGEPQRSHLRSKRSIDRRRSTRKAIPVIGMMRLRRSTDFLVPRKGVSGFFRLSGATRFLRKKCVFRRVRK
jgi:hypothetical protein